MDLFNFQLGEQRRLPSLVLDMLLEMDDLTFVTDALAVLSREMQEAQSAAKTLRYGNGSLALYLHTDGVPSKAISWLRLRARIEQCIDTMVGNEEMLVLTTKADVEMAADIMRLVSLVVSIAPQFRINVS